jgi:hypothetical protein
MKVKKINTVAAAIFITGVIGIASFCGYVWSSNSVVSNAQSAMSGLVQTNEKVGNVSQDLAADRDVIDIGWRTFQNDIPDDTSLVKWEEGSRVYYQITGPVNKNAIADTDYFDGPSKWGKDVEMEVFFDRGGGRYDQWLVNPDNAQILHYNGQRHFTGSSDLPESRYTCEVKGGRIVTTFWTHKNDTPGNIVFNYVSDSNGGTGRNLAWATTGTTPSGQRANHHTMGNWTNP